MKFFYSLLILLIFLLAPILAFAQDQANLIYKARVIEIIAQEKRVLSDGTEAEQQKLKLKFIDGDDIGQEFIVDGFSDFKIINNRLYKSGEKVLVVASLDEENKAHYYIVDYIRSSSLWYLVAVFVLALLAVGRTKGLRSLVSLALSFAIIIKFIIPQILDGANPILITLLGSFFILFFVIYFTEGFNAKSHIAISSIFISLIITVLLSWLFIIFSKLSGLASEETAHLISISQHTINFQGLLLAGIIIGALGVLDDVVISQVATVEQIIKANKYQSQREVFKKAYNVGISHISSMTNTLFLAYAGVSLSLLILFISGNSAFSTWDQIINNEAIATEIVRTLVGSIGLILSVPIATGMAVWKLGGKK